MKRTSFRSEPQEGEAKVSVQAAELHLLMSRQQTCGTLAKRWCGFRKCAQIQVEIEPAPGREQLGVITYVNHRGSKSLAESMSETGKVSEKSILNPLPALTTNLARALWASSSTSSIFCYLQWLVEGSSNCGGKVAKLQKLYLQLVRSQLV